MDVVYHILHSSLKTDKKGVIQDVTRWLLEIARFVKGGAWDFDFHSLYQNLNDAQRITLHQDMESHKKYIADEDKVSREKMEFYAKIKGLNSAEISKIQEPNFSDIIFPDLKFSKGLAPEFVQLIKDGLYYSYIEKLKARNNKK